MYTQPVQGWWIQTDRPATNDIQAIEKAFHRVTRPLCFLQNDSPLMARQGRIVASDSASPPTGTNAPIDGVPVKAMVPSLHPRQFGNPSLKSALGIHYAYMVGAMANGITSVEMVEAAGKAGLIAFFGAAGLSLQQIDSAIRRVRQRLPEGPFGFNLIHSPYDPLLEAETVRLYLDRGIRLVSASAFMSMSPHLVYYRVKGIHRGADGRIVVPNRIVAKVSREEVARKFFAPPPEKIVAHLLETAMIDETEAQLSASIPMADMLTAEADSGGHTDNRPALTLFPTMAAIRDASMAQYAYDNPLYLGLAGGIATPSSTAAAFAMGADYVLTGSINQACREAGTSKAVREMLAAAGQADVTMAPAADMFEMGVKVQVLKRGTMFALRAAKLYELYSRHQRYEDLSAKDRSFIEKSLLRRSFNEEWEHTRAYFADHDPGHIARAEKDPRHRMALVFRSYLGRSSNWANQGDPSRQVDYQIWCGPAMGAFNRWAQSSFLADIQQRRIVSVALNLLWGAAVIARLNIARLQGIRLPPMLYTTTPKALSELNALLDAN